ncbi:hypothetical protein [Candidatus Magnetominusculus xianensis]|nr:hypothetical protein [Candidatus Magnetominusculus xianensis]MBF0402777.1 hypothetical protein [Nitrospirota bacterium]
MIQKALEKWVDVPVSTGGTPSGATYPVAYHSSGQHEPILLKNLLYTTETITRDKPAVVVLDTKGYFQGELDKFRNSCVHLFAQALLFKVLAIGNSESRDSSILKDVVSDWCMDTPFDPVLIASKVKMLLTDTAAGQKRQSESDVLLDNLIGFLNIK